jgi:hypothetical protein
VATDAEISAEDPTPMMKVWAKDAKEFGIPYETQKGLMFLTAFGLRASYQPTELNDWIKFTRKLSKKIRPRQPHILTEDGGNFNDQNFSPLFTELAERFMGNDFSSRRLAGDTNGYKIWDREGKADQLPSCLKEGMWCLADWSAVMTSLCEQIGREIDMDLEGAYLAGFLYFDSCYPLDTGATMQMSMLVSGMLPPKFMWFRHMLNFDPELAAQGNSMQKVLDCFLSDVAHEAPLVYRLVTYLSDQLHYQAVGEKRQSVWDASTLEFACMTVPQSEYFDFGSPEGQEALADLRKYLTEKHNFTAPPVCQDLEAAVQAVGDHVFDRWGCSLLDEPADMAADRWTRRCCVLYTCVVFSILNPRWNKFS